MRLYIVFLLLFLITSPLSQAANFKFLNCLIDVKKTVQTTSSKIIPLKFKLNKISKINQGKKLTKSQLNLILNFSNNTDSSSDTLSSLKSLIHQLREEGLGPKVIKKIVLSPEVPNFNRIQGLNNVAVNDFLVEFELNKISKVNQDKKLTTSQIDLILNFSKNADSSSSNSSSFRNLIHQLKEEDLESKVIEKIVNSPKVPSFNKVQGLQDGLLDNILARFELNKINKAHQGKKLTTSQIDFILNFSKNTDSSSNSFSSFRNLIDKLKKEGLDSKIIKEIVLSPEIRNVDRTQGVYSGLIDDILDSQARQQRVMSKLQALEANVSGSKILELVKNLQYKKASQLSKISIKKLKRLNLMRKKAIKEISNGYNFTPITQPDLEGAFPFSKAYQGINDFFHSPERVVSRMQELEIEVMMKTKKKNPLASSQKAIDDLIVQREALHEFDKTVDLPAETLSIKDWNAMLYRGALFDDIVFDKNLDDQFRNGHGMITHRLQFHVLMREMEQNPKAFGADSFSKLPPVQTLYKALGDTKFNSQWPSLNWNENPWYHLFDGQSRNFHSPEFFHTQHIYFPGIGNWR